MARIDSLAPHLPGFLASEGVTLLGFSSGDSGYTDEFTVEASLPDSVHLRNWDGFQEFYRRAWVALDGKGRFVVSDRIRKVRLQFDFLASELRLEDSTGYFLPPRPPRFSQGSDRIRKTPSEAGMNDDGPNEDGTHGGVYCHGLVDLNGRLFYEMSEFFSQEGNPESGHMHTAPAIPHLVDAITGEVWRANFKNVWTRGEGKKIRLLYGFPDTTGQNWRVVSSNCSESGNFWQFHPYTRTLERISLEDLRTGAQERLPPEVRGEIVSVQESDSPEGADNTILSLVREGDRFVVLRSRDGHLFAQRWDPPSSAAVSAEKPDFRLGRESLHLGKMEFTLDEIEWLDLIPNSHPQDAPVQEDADSI